MPLHPSQGWHGADLFPSLLLWLLAGLRSSQTGGQRPPLAFCHVGLPIGPISNMAADFHWSKQMGGQVGVGGPKGGQQEGSQSLSVT